LNASETLNNPAHIAINTTVGTGSETTPAYVITDLSSPDAPHKWVGFDRAAITTLAINDPVLCMTQPPQFVAYTGFDTMAHASEAYVGRVPHLSCTPVALAAVRMVQENLREATYNPKNYKAMEGMVWAQYIAAQAVSSALLGILHSLSYAVCAYYDIHHGLNNGVGLPRVWTYNQPAAAEKYADIAEAMGVNTKNMSVPQAADAAIEAVIRLVEDCGCPENWGQVGEYPKTRMGKGYYEGQNHCRHPVRRRRAAEDGRAHDGRPVHAGQPARPHRRRGQGDPARLHVRRHGRQDVQRPPAELWGIAPEMGRRTEGYEARGSETGAGVGRQYD
jgi:formaldehyde dismutase / methanol dehydrogenase